MLCIVFLLGVLRGGYLLGWVAGIMLGVFLAFAAFLVFERIPIKFQIQNPANRRSIMLLLLCVDIHCHTDFNLG